MNNIYDLLYLLKIKFGSFARSFNIIHKIRFCNTKLDTQKEVSGSRSPVLLCLSYYVFLCKTQGMFRHCTINSFLH